MTEQRERLEYDVVIVGGGPAGLATAIRLAQVGGDSGAGLGVCLIDKGDEIGAHILSGAIIDTRALDELLPDWKARGAPLDTPVTGDEFRFLTGPASSLPVPRFLVPAPMHNAGKRIGSLGALCRWLAEEAAALGVDVIPGYAAVAPVFDSDGAVAGVVTADAGRARDGTRKPNFAPGVELRAKVTVFAEGARGHIGRQLIERFGLAAGRDAQHYGIGLKELWEIDPDVHAEGHVLHGAGWPLGGRASGGFFAYHAQGHQLALGLIVDLNYTNPWLSPFDELQRLKRHPVLARLLRGGRRIGFGARAITKGGANSLPRMSMPGALLVGCDAGTLNFAKIKGTHTAMKSGMIAAETVAAALTDGDQAAALDGFDTAFAASWAWRELETARNFGPALHRLGLVAGSAFNFVDQTICRGRLPLTLHERTPDHEKLEPADRCPRIDYPQPDGVLTFDRASSVYLTGTHHGEDQPCHLQLRDTELPIRHNLPRYAAPEQRYCPAGVYEIVRADDGPQLQINAQNCIHCKTCDIKDPGQNIVWVPPEAGGPVYGNM